MLRGPGSLEWMVGGKTGSGLTRRNEVKMEQRHNTRAGGTGAPRGDLPGNGNVRHDLTFTKYGKLSHSRIYSFKNHMALSRDVTRVQEAVNSLKSPVLATCYKCVRGLLDGVMQAMVCHHELKWRQNAHRLLVVPTDTDFHIAGDGKFAGLVEVNDGYCHLNDDGEYTHSLVFDYPSISQMKKTSKENNINVILVTPKESAEKYRVLEEMIDEVSVVSYTESHNLASNITDNFKKMSGTVKLTDNRGDNVDVKYFSNCGNQEETARDTCTSVDYDDEITFTASIKVASCPAGGAHNWRQLVIRPAGVDDSLVVQLDVACDCERCDSDTHLSETNSSACSGQGDLQCGACVCHEGFVGTRCECASSSIPEQDNPACRGSNGKTCSGYGSCICSTCQCSRRLNPQEKYYGHLCECDNFSCKRHEGKVCGDNGDCSCGKCVCHPGWTGEACQCADTMDGCRRSGETTICNDRGRCECGQCVCSRTEDGHHYLGQYCEESPIGPGLKCKFFQSCAECEVSSSKMSDECRNCSFYNAVLLDDIRVHGGSGGAVARALAYHHGDPGSILGGPTPGLSHMGIVLDDAACRRAFSGYSPFPRPCIPAPLRPSVSSHVVSGYDGHLRVPYGKPVTRRVLPRPGFTPRSNDGYDSDVDKICPISLEDKCIFYYRYRFQNSLYRLWVQKEMDCSPNILGKYYFVYSYVISSEFIIIMFTNVPPLGLIWASLNIEVLRADKGGTRYGAAPECKAGETEDPRENPPVSGIIRHDSHEEFLEQPGRKSNPVRLGGRRVVRPLLHRGSLVMETSGVEAPVSPSDHGAIFRV
ncbi:hypothetical protein PR048_015698 [Dryococelus australis]|uniref:Integrin beta n=1 Tax=Dryococelus australis TaxID=614101 RepID=A0ABQ9HHM8_9NEOP|nr:hypothetical protein PR048_015698 [Dryococelus australis]